MSITPPEIVTRKDPSGATLEPIERVIIELAPQFTNGIIEKLGLRKGIYEECVDLGKEKQRLVFTCPTRGLVGLRSELLNDTKGTGVMQSSFIGFQEYRGALKKNLKGAILSMAAGNCTGYALEDV
jgi:GTP-binding protein